MRNISEAEKNLQWLVLAGANESIGDTPVDRFAVPEEKAQPATAPEKSFFPSAPITPMPAERPVSETALQNVSSAHSATTLEELKEAVFRFDCPLKTGATNLVFGAGNPQADLMIVGEAPGFEEDRQGLPFVGASGKLLDLMLESIGIKRPDVYITNILPWRPLGNRKPSEAEVALFTPFVRRHIALIKPKILLMLGGSSVSALMNTNEGITRLRGRWMTYADDDISVPALASFHPAFLLRTPAQKKLAWRDLLAVRERLEQFS